MTKRSESESMFKRAVFGLNRAQVADYIALSEENLKRATEVFEEKLEDMKNTVDLLTKEKEGYAQNIEGLRRQLSEYMAKCEEYERVTEYNRRMKEDYSALEMEADNLRIQLESHKSRDENCSNLENKISELEDIISDLRTRSEFSKKEIEALKAKNKEITAEWMEDNKKLEQYIIKKRVEVAQGLRNHTYNLKRVKILIDTLKEAFDDTSDSFDEIEAY